MRKRLERRWRRAWMSAAYLPAVGRTARRLARLGMPPYTGCVPLAALHSRGYISPDARIHHDDFTLGEHCFIGDQVMVYADRGSSSVVLGDHVHVHENVTIQAGSDGQVRIGDGTHMQPRCQLSAYLSPLIIGRRAEIAPGCAFYTFSHGILPGRPIRGQPNETAGGIVLEDDVWLGYGTIVLDGVRIGAGAVISAGSVVTTSIPPEAIAAGVPARVVGFRREFARGPQALREAGADQRLA